MTIIDQLAQALLDGDNLSARALIQDMLETHLIISQWPMPETGDPRLRAAAASITELCAARQGQTPPPWVEGIPPLTEPMHLLQSARTMKRLREYCEKNSPPALRKRGFYAPPNFLEFA